MIRYHLSLRGAVAATALSVLPAPALAYGAYGHHVIAEIAMANVTPKTAAAIRALVARADKLDTPECATRTIEDLSVWPDCIRGLGDRYAYSGPWHYQNVNVCLAFDLTPACKDGNCVSAQVDRNAKRLANRKLSTHDRVEALAFLVHFTGDLHMPLHSGDHADRGGNDVRAAYGIYAPSRLNLHSVWDGPLAERAITTGPSLVHRYPRREAQRLAAGTAQSWSLEAWQISRAVTYPSAVGDAACTTPVPARAQIDDATVVRLVPVARLQVERAGLRLARLLDKALGGRG
ncbi:MAG: S1/P1 nuclease [Sphingomonas sp.]